MVPAAMGFTSKGRNQFRNAQADWVKIRAAINYDRQRQLLEKPAAEAVQLIVEQLGLADPEKDGGAARAVIRRGRQLSGVRASKPRG